MLATAALPGIAAVDATYIEEGNKGLKLENRICLEARTSTADFI